jgi:hypothetical protein
MGSRLARRLAVVAVFLVVAGMAVDPNADGKVELAGTPPVPASAVVCHHHHHRPGNRPGVPPDTTVSTAVPVDPDTPTGVAPTPTVDRWVAWWPDAYKLAPFVGAQLHTGWQGPPPV